MSYIRRVKYKCPECGEEFKSLGSLYGHLRFKHGIDAKADELKKTADTFIVEEEAPETAIEEASSFGKGLEEDLLENLKFAGLVGGYWEQKRRGIAKLFYSGEPTPERLFWAMKKAGCNPLQIDLALHLQFGDGVNFDEVAKKAQQFEKPKAEKNDEDDDFDWGEIDMDEEKLRKLIKEVIKEMQKENNDEETDIWRRIDRLMAYKALSKTLEEHSEPSLRHLLELKPLLGNDPQLLQRITELERKIADERDKAILEALIRTIGEKKGSDSSELLKLLLEHQSKSQEAIEKLKEKTEELRYQSMKEYLDRVINVVAQRESWDEELKQLIKEEMTKTLKEKMKSTPGEKSKIDIAREVIESTLDKIKEPVLRPVGEAIAENIRRGQMQGQVQRPVMPEINPEELERIERQKKQLELIENAELPKE